MKYSLATNIKFTCNYPLTADTHIYSNCRISKLYYVLNWKTLKVKARHHSLLLHIKRNIYVYCLIYA
jgi:hypothetical protein